MFISSSSICCSSQTSFSGQVNILRIEESALRSSSVEKLFWSHDRFHIHYWFNRVEIKSFLLD